MRALFIGGSAGSFQLVAEILSALPKNLHVPVFLVLHRLKYVRAGLQEALSINSSLPIIEPNDKQKIVAGKIYLAPSNYHMHIENNHTIALSIYDLVQYSRPSIDVTCFSASEVYKEGLTALILSGANNDGTEGSIIVKKNNGTLIVQSPDDCEVSTMTANIIKNVSPDYALKTHEIINFIKNYNG